MDQQTPNSLPSDEHSELHFEANETECGPVSYDNCVELDKLEQNSVVVVKGRLRENIAFWRSIGASQWLLNVLCEGYCLPFVDFPAIKFFPNHKSALCHAEFVSVEISKLLVSGAIVEVLSADLRVCNSLGVAVNSSGKPRLILDLRYVNQHLRSCKFKYEDVRTAADLFHKGDWFFKFDYSSGYHHLEIFPGHTPFLGFSWRVDGHSSFYKFTVLPFGLSTGPYLFTKVQRTLTKHWRSQGIRIFTYLDDGAGADSSFQEAQEVSDLVRRDVKLSGFVANEIKSQWTPAQRGELLGFVLDLSAGTFQVPQRRVDSFCVLLETVVSKGFVASARQLSRFTGLLSSMGLALGPVVRLWTRSLYRDILRSASWDSPFRMSDDAVSEVLFWQDNFNNSGYPIWSPSPKPEVLSFSDASESGWGGFTAQVGGKVAVGSWSLEEMGRSSTFRELRATRRVLEALAPHLKGSEVLHRTDNKNTEITLSIGSRQADLHDEAVSVYKLCRAYDIRLTVEWVSRDYNVVADELSRIEDENDYMLDRSCFRSLDRLWGPHLVDRFASEKTKQLDRFCSRFLNPGCEAADAFTVSWTGVNNWLFPPPFLVPRVLRHMSVGKEDGTLLVPEWRSAPWWPLLVTRRGRWREFVVDYRQIQPYEGIFVPGSAASSIFSSGTPAFSLLALKLKFSSTSAPINTPSVALYAVDEDASAVLASHGPAGLHSS